MQNTKGERPTGGLNPVEKERWGGGATATATYSGERQKGRGLGCKQKGRWEGGGVEGACFLKGTTQTITFLYLVYNKKAGG